MLGLVEFLGLAPRALRTLPTVVYFHENQLAYPVRHPDARDLHFVFTNLTTAAGADAVWFNSVHNRDTLLAGLAELLAGMPDHRSPDVLADITEKARVLSPGISLVQASAHRIGGPLRILWAARWEHDKGPETFFAALALLEQQDVDFRVSVIGEQFSSVPEVFARARETFAPRIDRWGHQDSRADYEATLAESDVVVSTAAHEFFGIAIAEAVSAGCVPVLPQRLAYPELYDADSLYDGSAPGLARRLARLAQQKVECGRLGSPDVERVRRFGWDRVGPELDAAIESVVRESGGRVGRCIDP
jgi:glycosyltransferase involved in cell wall biosynthesis